MTKLLEGLKRTVVHLENNTVWYDWTKHKSCNCGIVAQCILGKSPDEIHSLLNPMLIDAAKSPNNTGTGIPSWRDSIKDVCPTTGKRIYQIIRELEYAGMTRADIAHLEFMENEAILAASGIPKIEKYADVPDGEETTYETREEIVDRKVTSASPVKRLLGIPDRIQEKITRTTPITLYRKQLVGMEYEKDYYQKQSNLILYLKAWIRILEGNAPKMETDRQQLKADLLVAVNEENYPEAARLRDLLLLD